MKAVLFCAALAVAGIVLFVAFMPRDSSAYAPVAAISACAPIAALSAQVSEPPVIITLPPAEPAAVPDPWTEEDVTAIARTLSGECYDDKPQDKRLVAEVILNRVSAAQWDDTVIEVVTAKGQFHGYRQPGRDISDNDLEIAVQALRDWHANGCAALSEYLFFEAGQNRENVFRHEY